MSIRKVRSLKYKIRSFLESLPKWTSEARIPLDHVMLRRIMNICFAVYLIRKNLRSWRINNDLSRIALFPESCCPSQLCFPESLIEVLRLSYSMALVAAVDGISVHELVKQFQELCTACWIACPVACVQLNTLYRENIQTEPKRSQNPTTS